MKVTREELLKIIGEESAAAKAAKKAGLVHLGFGRYGPKKGDKATHQSKDGKLVSVGDDTGGGEPEDKPFGGDTGTDADFPGEPPEGTREPEDAEEPEQSAHDKMGLEARELKLTMDSSEEGYKQQYIPILKNLSRKMKKGTYDKEKAVKLMMYYVSNGAKRYEKDFGGGGATGPSVGGFDKKTREEAARAYVEDFEDDWDNKNWDFMESIMFNGNKYRRINEDWWSDMSSDQQDSYIKKHPGSKQAQDAKEKDTSSVSRKGVDKVTSGTKAFSDKDTQETFDNIVNDENQRGRDIIDYGNMKAPLSARQHDNLVKGKRTAHLVKSSDPADKLKLLKIVSRVAKKNEMSRTGKELGETKMMKIESLLKENPAVAAAAAMATIKLMNPQTGRPNKAITALRNKDNPSHGKAVGIFQKLKNKFKKSDFDKEKDKVAKGADDWVKKQSQSDADFYKKQYAARTGKELGEIKMNESIKFHTITGNKRFMTKTALPILRKYGAKNVTVNQVAGDFLEIRFPIDSRKLKELDKELKRKNKKAYGGIVENRRNKMTKSQLREIIREVIKEEEDAFNQAIPAAIERYMKKFISAVQSGNLNRKRKIAILGRVVVALGLEPGEVSKYARLVKRGL